MASSLLFVLLAFVVTSGATELRVYDLRASDLPADIFGISDAYVKAFCGPGILGITDVRHNNINPWWDDVFIYYNFQDGDVLRLEVYDEDLGHDDLLGVCNKPLNMGTHHYSCYLEKGGVLHYSYTLS
ncbi:perforin-1-like [Synchiropus splendidus]|uniref:perforin-1-like n=1 Tax=Synchiropus splendidus TaxID=270530 RepID=UPI00237E0AE1|nr:perforin-1-like [Synchiropus splendidus]